MTSKEFIAQIKAVSSTFADMESRVEVQSYFLDLLFHCEGLYRKFKLDAKTSMKGIKIIKDTAMQYGLDKEEQDRLIASRDEFYNSGNRLIVRTIPKKQSKEILFLKNAEIDTPNISFRRIVFKEKSNDYFNCKYTGEVSGDADMKFNVNSLPVGFFSNFYSSDFPQEILCEVKEEQGIASLNSISIYMMEA